jgi:hypothetical protein
MDELKLPGNKTFQISNKQKCIETQIRFKGITKLYKDNTFENPTQQTDLDDDKINQMVVSYLKNPEYLIYKNKIIIAVLMNTDKTDYNLYLVDGQHRINMGIKLYEEHNICDYLILCYYKMNKLEEIEELFNECNHDSYKNKIEFDKDIVKKIKYNELKVILKNKYSEIFSKTKASNNVRYSISEFLNILSDKNYFDNLSVIEIILNIEMKNKLFNKKIDYQGYIDIDDSNLFYKDEINCIKNGLIFSLKNNNFIEYLLDESTIPDHTFKYPKNRITPALRIIIWNKFYDNDEDKCNVYKCKNKICNDADGFECGFKLSKKNGGEYTIDNLVPICKECHNKIGSTNYDDFIEHRKKEYKVSKQILEN